jgi:acetyl-CoA carboxylase carboxyl transferase subunit alpha
MDSKPNDAPQQRGDNRQPSGPAAGQNSTVARRDLQADSELQLGEEAAAIPVVPGPGAQPDTGIVLEAGQARSAWDRVQLARHPQRPHALDYIPRIFNDFQEIHGDRYFGEDPAIVCGMALLDGQPVMVIGQQKGRDTKQKLYRNFGMPKPEGYRKALRAMKLAEKFGRPIHTLLDTPGAYPGIDAEERGQAEAIARNLFSMAQIKTPIVVTCIGEGGSGGALALGVGNRILMLENAVYSVISPESCAAIVWRDSSKAELAAAALKLTSEDLLGLGLVDEVVKEPPQGAHTDHDAAAELLGAALRENLKRIQGLSEQDLLQDRYAKFRAMGSFFEQ